MTLQGQTANYEMVDGVQVVHLADPASKTEVRILPSLGNNAYSMKVNGEEIFWSPFASPKEAKEKPALFGNPFLAPWANRIEGWSYWVNGKEYRLNEALGNVRPDGNKNPIHGLALFTDRWKVVDLKVQDGAATVRSRLEFHRYPDWMAQFPFAHAIDMIYRLKNGTLEVVTEIENLSAEPMPVAIGYHPYYRLPGGRDAWTLTIPARKHVELSPNLIPTGERSMVKYTVLPLKGNQQDDVYTSLILNSRATSEFAMTDGKRKIVFGFGPKYPVGVVYAPPGRDFVCFEPMAAITDGFNQHHKGRYAALQTIAPGQKWSESWTIRPEGY